MPTMMLRSAASKDAQHQVAEVHAVGSFVELRSEDPSAKPWLARISASRQVKGEEGADGPTTVEEVECEWVWHPSEAMKDFDLDDGYDPEFYGSREVFLGGKGSGESGRDWNSVDSVKFRVFVFPFDMYKQVVGTGFQMQLHPNDPSSLTILDPLRCWYYRQALYIDEHNVKTLNPRSLPCVIHRPNPDYHVWCHQRGISVKLSPPTDEHSVPPRTVLVPENPERTYFYCTDCQRRFEHRQGDCIDPSQLHDNKFVRKTHINMEDVPIVCPLCKEIRSEGSANGQPSPKRPRLNSENLSGSSELWNKSMSMESGEQEEEQREKAEQTRRENQRKQGRYERVSAIFQKSIQEVIGAGLEESLLYKDAQALADLFFDRFEVYSTENQLNTKMEHQKLHEIFQNIKRENNTDLRRRIVTGEMKIDELIAADVKDLAPESLRKRREAEQKKYFQQQVLLSSAPESLRVIRKTHKGLEVVEDEDVPPSERDGEQKPVEEVDSETLLNIQLSLPDDNVTASTPALPSIQEIISETFQSRRDRGPPDSDLVDLPFPLAREWKAAKTLLNDHQVLPPPEFLGLPNGQQSKGLVMAKLRAIGMNEKIIADIAAYADTPAYH